MPRYIDANNLELSLMFSKDVYENVSEDGLHSVISIIDSMPTVDVQEVKHGRWLYKEEIYGDSTWECSVCGEPYILLYGTPSDNLYNYCPNCGSLMMDGDDNA